jgi:cytochrome c2
MRLLFIIWLILAFSTEAQEIDAVSGLIKNPGWKLVNANCSACHSIKMDARNAKAVAIRPDN